MNRNHDMAQLYSTASYQAHDLTGIGLRCNNLAGVNLAGQNLTNANFNYATLTGANFSQANLTDATFNAATLTNANLSQANLTNANFDLRHSDRREPDRGGSARALNFTKYGIGTGLTLAQLYSTASYQAHDLTGIGLGDTTLPA